MRCELGRHPPTQAQAASVHDRVDDAKQNGHDACKTLNNKDMRKVEKVAMAVDSARMATRLVESSSSSLLLPKRGDTDKMAVIV